MSAQERDPAESAMILKPRDLSVVEHQAAGEQQYRLCQIQLALFAAQRARELVLSAIALARDVKTEFPRRPIVPLKRRVLVPSPGGAQQAATRPAHERQQEVPKRDRQGKLRRRRVVIIRWITVAQLLPRSEENGGNLPVGRIWKARDFFRANLSALGIAPTTVQLALALGGFDNQMSLLQRPTGIDQIEHLSLWRHHAGHASIRRLHGAPKRLQLLLPAWRRRLPGWPRILTDLASKLIIPVIGFKKLQRWAARRLCQETLLLRRQHGCPDMLACH